MYKISAVLLLIAVVCSAIPVDQHEVDVEDLEQYEHAGRQARATCDLLSFQAGGFSVGHAACAAHCLALGGGRRGGRCINGVCNCRK